MGDEAAFSVSATLGRLRKRIGEQLFFPRRNPAHEGGGNESKPGGSEGWRALFLPAVIKVALGTAGGIAVCCWTAGQLAGSAPQAGVPDNPF
jgi:hypothetical protein